MDSRGDIWGDDPARGGWPTRWDVRHVAETGSTNADLLALVEAGDAGDRTVLLADHQTAGRGRLDRPWDSPRGANLLVSIAVAPVPSPPSEATHRIGLAALAAVRSMRPDLGVSLKWPNDVLVDGRKLAGILAQRASAADAVVVGLGLNVGWAPEGAAALDVDGSPADVLRLVLSALDELPADVAAAYRSELSTLGRRVRVELPGGAVAFGTAIDLDDDGRLVVEASDGTITSYGVGDIVHLRPGDRDHGDHIV
ncbi:MAG: biotin--[acetyl-CoA-carboxylase] ligase [Ilumatobacteraceae bacterium]